MSSPDYLYLPPRVTLSGAYVLSERACLLSCYYGWDPSALLVDTPLTREWLAVVDDLYDGLDAIGVVEATCRAVLHVLTRLLVPAVGVDGVPLPLGSPQVGYQALFAETSANLAAHLLAHGTRHADPFVSPVPRLCPTTTAIDANFTLRDLPDDLLLAHQLLFPSGPFLHLLSSGPAVHEVYLLTGDVVERLALHALSPPGMYGCG